MKTLLLDRTTWDLVIDAAGNIAVASDPYSQAQDMASAIRLFLGECWYDTTRGIPYWSQILGHRPPAALMKAQFIRAALTVPGVASAVCFLTTGPARAVLGQVQARTTAGASVAASSGALPKLPFAITQDGTPGLDDYGQHIIAG